jgi:hypothetical protein
MTRLDEFLTAAEFDALEQVDEGRNKPIATNLSDRLLELGYFKETLLAWLPPAWAKCVWRWACGLEHLSVQGLCKIDRPHVVVTDGGRVAVIPVYRDAAP